MCHLPKLALAMAALVAALLWAYTWWTSPPAFRIATEPIVVSTPGYPDVITYSPHQAVLEAQRRGGGIVKIPVGLHREPSD